MFEQIDDETELLLPDNLTKTDSVIFGMVNAIPEEDWQQVEIIGWLYQFYISEKKDEVIGKVVKSEDIPAATQLFTPNWIVKYMVQNSLGAQWMATYPDSKLKEQMEYYIEPAEQNDEVNEQLAVITPSTLDPEKLTLIDPASGSGHILVEAYDLFKAIYLERGYRQRDVAQLILEKNLYGLDIDKRAAQLTGFALMMKGRADDRSLFQRGIKLNVMALQDSTSFDAEVLINGLKLSDFGLKLIDLTELKRLFEHATTFGSLIQVSEELAERLPALKRMCQASSEDMFVSDVLKQLVPLVQQAEILAAQYDAVVANPPYMGSGFYCPVLKKLVTQTYKEGKTDLYGAFILRNIQLAMNYGHISMITIPNWMFLSSFEALRDCVFHDAPILSLVHNGRGVWGSDFGSCAFVLQKSSISNIAGRFLRLFEKQGSVANNKELERRFHAKPRFTTPNSELKKIPGSPVAYWVSKKQIELMKFEPLSKVATFKEGITTANNDMFLRFWAEVDYFKITFGASLSSSDMQWVPYNKGGAFRRWYGNQFHVVDWRSNGSRIRGYNGSSFRNPTYHFQNGATFSALSIGQLSVRFSGCGFAFDSKGTMLFSEKKLEAVVAYLNSKICSDLLKLVTPTVDFRFGTIQKLPFLDSDHKNFRKLVSISKFDWDSYERSWDFQSLPIVTASLESAPAYSSTPTVCRTDSPPTFPSSRSPLR